MKNSTQLKHTLASFSLAVGIASGLADPLQAGEYSDKGNPKYKTTTELEWTETGIGPVVSPIQGKFAETGHITYFRFLPGIKTALHTHSHDYVGIVVAGNMKHWVPGKPETEIVLPAGSNWSMPKNQEHISECLSGVDCLAVVIQKEKFDYLPVEK